MVFWLKLIVLLTLNKVPHSWGFMFATLLVDFNFIIFLGMNGFKIAIGRESDFEDFWKN